LAGPEAVAHRCDEAAEPGRLEGAACYSRTEALHWNEHHAQAGVETGERQKRGWHRIGKLEHDAIAGLNVAFLEIDWMPEMRPRSSENRHV
jgi:hypothetical protein